MFVFDKLNVYVPYTQVKFAMFCYFVIKEDHFHDRIGTPIINAFF